MVTLYAHPVSPYAQKVMIALIEKSVEYESKLPDFVAGDLREFARYNPRLEAPVLLDGELAVFDSTIILEYVEERWPTPPLAPSDAAGRARARMIEEVCDTHYEPIVWGMLELQGFKRGAGEVGERLMARAGAQLAGVHAWLERQLGDRAFFNGDSFGRADLSVAPMMQWAVLRKHPPAAGSRLAAWFARVSERPSVAQTLNNCRDMTAQLEPGLPQWIAQGSPFKREYRDHRLDWVIRTGGLEIVVDGMKQGNIRFTTELE
jgi:glutathione S-transferase/RNA polymerase-associated protein